MRRHGIAADVLPASSSSASRQCGSGLSVRDLCRSGCVSHVCAVQLCVGCSAVHQDCIRRRGLGGSCVDHAGNCSGRSSVADPGDIKSETAALVSVSLVPGLAKPPPGRTPGYLCVTPGHEPLRSPRRHRQQPEARARAPTTEQRGVFRAPVILLADEGRSPTARRAPCREWSALGVVALP
jgi:hypothetical protein